MSIKQLVRDDDAVSPVIGVILMVAITVILAAVIGAFVLGLGDSVEEEIRAGASITEEGDDVVVTWTSEGNAGSLQATDGSTDQNLDSVGDSVTFSSVSEGTTITVIAFEDSGQSGKSTVIAQRTI